MRRTTPDTRPYTLRMRSPRRTRAPGRRRGPRPKTCDHPQHEKRHRRPSQIRQRKQSLPKAEGTSTPIETHRHENPQPVHLIPRIARATSKVGNTAKADTNVQRALAVSHQTWQRTLVTDHT